MSAYSCNTYMTNLYSAVLSFEKIGSDALAKKYTAVFNTYYERLAAAGVQLDF